MQVTFRHLIEREFVPGSPQRKALTQLESGIDTSTLAGREAVRNAVQGLGAKSPLGKRLQQETGIWLT